MSRPIPTRIVMLALALGLMACGRTPKGVGGLSPEDSEALNKAAAQLDKERLQGLPTADIADVAVDGVAGVPPVAPPSTPPPATATTDAPRQAGAAAALPQPTKGSH